MANPQPIPFVQFSKELYDAILRSPMPGTQKGIVLAIVRRTYGDGGRKQAEVSLGLLHAMLGQDKGTIRRALRDLCDRGVVRVVRPAEFRRPQVLALNKDYETWGSYSVDTVGAEATVEQAATVGAEATATVAVEPPSDVQTVAVWPLPSRPPGHSPVGPQATIEDRETVEKEQKSSSPKRPVVSAPDWDARAAALIEASHFPSDLMQLGELLAAGNKTGKASLSRIVREIYEPIVALQDELPDAAIRYGLRAAITKGAPNANYVAKAARGYQGNGNAPATNSFADELTDEDRDFFTVTER